MASLVPLQKTHAPASDISLVTQLAPLTAWWPVYQTSLFVVWTLVTSQWVWQQLNPRQASETESPPAAQTRHKGLANLTTVAGRVMPTTERAAMAWISVDYSSTLAAIKLLHYAAAVCHVIMLLYPAVVAPCCH